MPFPASVEADVLFKSVIEVDQKPRETFERKKEQVMTSYESDSAAVYATTKSEVGKVFASFKEITEKVLADAEAKYGKMP